MTSTVEQFRELQEALGHGCGDGHCVIERRRGQHTNGGCKCLSYADSIELGRIGRMLTAAQKMADQIVEIEAELVRRIKEAEGNKSAAMSDRSKRREHNRMHALSDALGAIRSIVGA